MHWKILEANRVRERLRRRGPRIVDLALNFHSFRHVDLCIREDSFTITPRRTLDGDRQDVDAAVDRRAEL